jgi:hypothetical protein
VTPYYQDDAHAKDECDLGGCDICLSYWELLALMLDEQRRRLGYDPLNPPPSLPVAADPKNEDA